jgi:hypothetical protein
MVMIKITTSFLRYSFLPVDVIRPGHERKEIYYISSKTCYSRKNETTEFTRQDKGLSIRHSYGNNLYDFCMEFNLLHFHVMTGKWRCHVIELSLVYSPAS